MCQSTPSLPPMLLRVALAALLLLVPGPLAAQSFPADDELLELLQARIEAGRGVGIVLGVLEADGRTRVVVAGSSGEGREPLDDRTVFEIGSITKVFTSTLLADMAGRGELSLTDPVAKYLPEEVRVPSRAGREITLLDLATHRSALPRLPQNMTPADPSNPYADYRVEQMYAFLSSYELPRDIGARFEYSNLGVGLLGHALSLAADTPYETLVRQRILGPLGMGDTGIRLTAAMDASVAQGHNPRLMPVPLWDLPTLAGAGALRSNLRDMLRFLDANVGEADSQIEAAMRAAHEPRFEFSRGEAEPLIGLNWLIQDPGGRRIVWHNGGTGGFASFLGFDPEREIGVVLLANSAHSVTDIGMHLLDPTLPLATAPTQWWVGSLGWLALAGILHGLASRASQRSALAGEGGMMFGPGGEATAATARPWWVIWARTLSFGALLAAAMPLLMILLA